MRLGLLAVLFGVSGTAFAQEAGAQEDGAQEAGAPMPTEPGDTREVVIERSGTDFRALAELEGAVEEARMRFSLGQRYYQTGRFAEAAVEFRASYELTRLKDLLYNVFLAHREAGNLDGAIEALEAFIEATPPGTVRESARARLRTTRALRDRLTASERAEGADAEAELEPELEAEPEPAFELEAE
ncbi:MAG: hypothetical protein AAF411_15825, partial [Myxococcota bacterium]